MICAERFFKFIWLGEIDRAEFEAAVALQVGMGGKLPPKFNGGPRSAMQSFAAHHSASPCRGQTSFPQIFRGSPEASLSGGGSQPISLGSTSPTLRFRIQANPSALDGSDSEHCFDSEDKGRNELEAPKEEEKKREKTDTALMKEEEEEGEIDEGQIHSFRNDNPEAASNGVPRGKHHALVDPRFYDGSILVTWSPPESPQHPHMPIRSSHPLAGDHEMQERLLQLSPVRKPPKETKRGEGRRKKRFRLRRSRKEPEDLELVSSV